MEGYQVKLCLRCDHLSQIKVIVDDNGFCSRNCSSEMGNKIFTEVSYSFIISPTFDLQTTYMLLVANESFNQLD